MTITKGHNSAFPANGNAGLSKREYFAALAMQGLVGVPSPMTAAMIAKWSVEQANALIEALNADTRENNP